MLPKQLVTESLKNYFQDKYDSIDIRTMQPTRDNRAVATVLTPDKKYFKCKINRDGVYDCQPADVLVAEAYYGENIY